MDKANESDVGHSECLPGALSCNPGAPQPQTGKAEQKRRRIATLVESYVVAFCIVILVVVTLVMVTLTMVTQEYLVLKVQGLGKELRSTEGA